jgi:hypothetical protein
MTRYMVGAIRVTNYELRIKLRCPQLQLREKEEAKKIGL